MASKPLTPRELALLADEPSAFTFEKGPPLGASFHTPIALPAEPVSILPPDFTQTPYVPKDE